MIQIQTLKIEEFRGIRDLTLNLEQSSFGICGPNGTGKSGVVDAIEFVLTGDVSRLSGHGTGDLSVKSHAPHVDSNKSPEKARVELTAFIPSLGKSAVISRTVAKSANYDLDPDELDIRAVFDELQIHPEFALSRREIIRYILARPNDRAQDVQELLRLDDVETARKALTNVANQLQRERNQKQQAHLEEHKALLQILELDQTDQNAILEKINSKRSVLSLPPLEELKTTTSFRMGVPDPTKVHAPALKKADAQADLTMLAKFETKGEPQDVASKRQIALSDLQGLIDDVGLLRTLKQQSLVTAGIELVDGDACPLCDLEWDRETLLEHLSAKLDGVRHATTLLNKLNENVNHVIAERESLSSVLDRLVAVCAKLTPVVPADCISAHAKRITTGTNSLRTFVANFSGLSDAKEALEQEWWIPPTDVQERINACSKGIAALPDVSEKDVARDFLTRAEDQYRRVVATHAAFKTEDSRSSIADKVLETYTENRDAILKSLYDEVAEDFSGYYRSLNPNDEREFVGNLIPSAAKLGFNVDFYGRGKFPPGAYHSEGHQDGMGVCLYLALMKRTQGKKFRFSVLDDVLMSIDADHRREVCKLLKREFPDTQFIVTTHDRVWLKFMHTEGLIQNSQTFGAWSVEAGPRVWKNQEIWAEIEEELEKNDIEAAAAKLRHYLEYVATLQADSLQAHVRYKGDGQYSLNDLMPSVINRWRRKVSDAVKAAKSWGQAENEAELLNLLARIDDAKTRINAEQWAVNPAVHYNQWANFQIAEFREVLRAFTDLLATMQCDVCNALVELQPRDKAAKTIRCNCGVIAINLSMNEA